MKTLDVEDGDSISLVNGGKSRTSKARPLCILATGLVFLSIGMFIGLFAPKYIHDKMIDASVVCDTTDPDYKGWLSNVDSDVAGYRDWYVYDVTNAEAVLTGAKPVVHEKGPWVHRCFSTKYNVKFEGATVSFKTFMNCAFDADNERNCEDCDDTTTKVTFMNPGYGQLLRTAYNEGMIFLQGAGCSTEQIKAIGDIGSPFDPTTGAPTGKVMACDWTTGAPMTPGSAGADDNTKTAASQGLAAIVGADTWVDENGDKKGECGCCIPDTIDPTSTPTHVTGAMAVYGMEALGYYTDNVLFLDGTVARDEQLGKGLCANLANGANGVGDNLSMLAKWDGGVKTDIISTAVPQVPTPTGMVDNFQYSEAFISKTVNELAYGFPSSMLGHFLSGPVMEAAAAAAAAKAAPDSPTEEDITTEKMNFLGNVPALDGSTLGGYTSDVAKVCMATCDFPIVGLDSDGAPVRFNPLADPTDTTTIYGSSCGRAPEAEDLDDDVKYLAGIDCAPFTGTWIANVGCVLAGLSADVAAGGTGANYENLINTYGLCKCATGSPGTDATLSDFFGTTVDMVAIGTRVATGGAMSLQGSDLGGSMCCMGGGAIGTTKMEGKGCIAPSPGFIVSDRNIFTEEQAEAFSTTLKIDATTGLPKKSKQETKVNTGCDVTKDEGENVLEYIEYEEKTEHAVWKPVTGANYATGTAVKPNFPVVADLDEFNKGEDATIVSEKAEGKYGGTQIEATGLKTRKWASKGFNNGKPSEEMFKVYVSQLNRAVEVSTETTVLKDGVTLQRYMPSKSLLASNSENEAQGLGITAGLAVGTYAYGLPILFAQPNFLYGDASLYTDIDLYATYNAEDGKKLDPIKKMDKEYVEANVEHYELKLDIDPSTGKAFEGHNRLMAAFYTMKCDPFLLGSDMKQRSPDCALFAQLSMTSATTADGSYPLSVANVFSPNMKPDVAIPAFWMDETAQATEGMLKAYVSRAEQMQYADAVAIVLGFIGFTMIVFGIFGCLCGKRG